MKKLIFSFFIIFSSMNVFAHDSEISRIDKIKYLVKELDRDPDLFPLSDKTCDAKFIKYWLSTSEMFWKSEFNDIVYPHICEELKRDPEINLAFIKKSPSMILEIIDPKLVSNYDELAETAVSKSAWNLKYVKPEALSSSEKYDELALTAVKAESEVFKRIDPKLVSNYDELAKTAVSSSGWKLRHVKPEALINPKLYDKLAETAVSKVAEVFEYVKPEFLSSPKVYDNLATAYVMLVVANYLEEDKFLSKEYNLRYLSGFQNVKPDALSSSEKYDELALFVLSFNVDGLKYIKPEGLSSEEMYDIVRNINSYDQIVMDELGKDTGYIKDVSKKAVFYLNGIISKRGQRLTKRRKLLKYIKSLSRCDAFKKLLRNCKTAEEIEAVDQWLKDYDDYEKEQKANLSKTLNMLPYLDIGNLVIAGPDGLFTD